MCIYIYIYVPGVRIRGRPPPRGGSPSDLHVSLWTNPRVPPIGLASLERPTGRPSGPGSLGGQDLAAGMPVGRFDKLLADSSINGCVVWVWEFSEVTVYVLHAVSKYRCIHLCVQHGCGHICMNECMQYACTRVCMRACMQM